MERLPIARSQTDSKGSRLSRICGTSFRLRGFDLPGDYTFSLLQEGYDITRSNMAEMAKIYESMGAGGKIQCWFEKEGGHRPYPACKVALEWIHKHIGTPGWSLEEIHSLPTINTTSELK